MIDFENVFILTQKELRDAARNRWLLLYTIAFGLLSLTLASMALAGGGNAGLAGYGRTAATLINLVLLIVPLMGLTLGALSLAGEREQGTLAYLMAQPINRAEMLLGKFLGLGTALGAALALGFGATALLIAAGGGGGPAGAYLILVTLACLLALVSLALGFLISAAARRAATAVGVSLFLWLALVFFGDLGLMGTALVLRIDIQQLFALSLLNPLQVFKLAAALDLRGNLELFGPAGVYAMRTFGSGLLPLLLSLLVAWIVLPLGAAAAIFKRRGVL